MKLEYRYKITSKMMERSRWPFLLCWLMCFSVKGLALYSDSPSVVDLATFDFARLVVQPDEVALVHFYVPGSEQCKALAPKISTVADKLKGMALVGAVDCSDKSEGKALCERYGVRGFPTIKLFGSERSRNPYTGEIDKEAGDYKGPASAKALSDAMTGLLSDKHIRKLGSQADAAEWGAVAKAAGKTQVLLFTDKSGSTPLYRALSTQLRRAGLAFGQVHASVSEVVAAAGVRNFPTLMVVKPDGSRKVYDGELKAPALLEFLAAFRSATLSPDEELEKELSGRQTDSSSGKAWAFVRQVEGLSEVLAADGREDMALVALHGAEGDQGCSTAREAFLSAAGEMQAVVDTLLVSVPAGDLASGQQLRRRLGVDVGALAKEPCELQVVLLPFGKEKPELEDYRKYTGSPDGKSLQRWVTDAVPSSMVTPLDDSTGTTFLVQDPSEGRMVVAPKVVLFTNKDEAPGVFKALAMALRGRGNMMFAWMQVGNPAAKVTLENIKPHRVPGMTVVMPSPVDEQGKQGVRFGMQPYGGALKFAPMKEFLSEMAQQVELASGIVNDPELSAKTLPEVTSQSEMAEHCTTPAGMCLMALLDPTAPGFEQERKELVSMALQQSRTSTALHFLWLDGRKYKRVAQALGVLSSDLPTMVALSARRMRFAVMPAPKADSGSGSRGPKMTVEAVGRFIEGVMSAKIRTLPLQALPEIREGGDEAGGAPETTSASGPAGADSGSSGAGDVPVEDEFDLSDILSEEVERIGVGSKADRLKEVEEQLKAEEAARQAAEKAAKAGGSKKKKKKSMSKKSKKEEL